MDDDAFVDHCLQDNVMIQVPMDDGGQAQFRQVVKLKAECAERQVEMPCRPYQRVQRHTVHGYRVAAPQGAEIYTMAMVAGDHGKAGEAAIPDAAVRHDGGARSAGR